MDGPNHDCTHSHGVLTSATGAGAHVAKMVGVHMAGKTALLEVRPVTWLQNFCRFLLIRPGEHPSKATIVAPYRTPCSTQKCNMTRNNAPNTPRTFGHVVCSCRGCSRCCRRFLALTISSSCTGVHAHPSPKKRSNCVFAVPWFALR